MWYLPYGGTCAWQQRLRAGRGRGPHAFPILALLSADHARQLTKSMMRKAILDRLVAHREEDIQNFISFISKESIQKSLRMYMEMLKKKKS